MTGEAEFDEVFFTEVDLPAEQLLGPLHGGWASAWRFSPSGAGHIGTAIIGLERRLESMAKLAEGATSVPSNVSVSRR
jgi:alkylation response protein AidB-like acyl-CoA dehydrogenase